MLGLACIGFSIVVASLDGHFALARRSVWARCAHTVYAKTAGMLSACAGIPEGATLVTFEHTLSSGLGAFSTRPLRSRCWRQRNSGFQHHRLQPVADPSAFAHAPHQARYSVACHSAEGATAAGHRNHNSA